MEINGLPLHPLVVHAVVVLSPLAALGGLLYAAVPRWRWWLRWPLVLATLAAAGAAVVAVAAGQSLLESRPELEGLPAVGTHRQAGDLLRNVLLLDAVVVVVAAWWLGGPSALASGRGKGSERGAAGWVLAAVLAIASVVVLYAVFRAGDTGARAVWG
ncbi:MAG: DUF2231 domain-containing protein [Nocardioidaceae bacterium]